MNRQEELLEAAAAAFGDSRDPFSHDWLAEHSVTLDECGDLSGVISTIIYGYLETPPDERGALHLRGACRGAGVPKEVTAGAVASLELRRITRRLEASRSPTDRKATGKAT